MIVVSDWPDSCDHVTADLTQDCAQFQTSNRAVFERN